MATARDWEAYRTAVVDVAPADRPAFRIVPDGAGRTDAWPGGQAVPVVVVTAWNPDSIRLDPDVNAVRQWILAFELGTRGLAWWPATGRDLGNGHHEDGVAVPGLSEEEGRDLGRRHGQAAIYVWTPEAWEAVSCDRDLRVTLGWRLTGVPDTPGRSVSST